MGSSPSKPKKTAQQKAMEKRQSMLLDEEIEEQEELLKLQARGTLGTQSLLAGAPRTARESAGRRTGGSMLGSGGARSAGATSPSQVTANRSRGYTTRNRPSGGR